MRRSPSSLLISFLFVFTAWAAPRPARGAEPDETPNACGCYRTSAGACYCGRKTKCGCPGECEPKGCEEKRAKQLEKEIREEERKAQEAGRKAQKSGGDDAQEAPARPAAKEPKEARESKESGKEKEEKAAPRPKLTAAQRRDLAKLLDAYMAANPEAGGKTVEQARQDLGGSGR